MIYYALVGALVGFALFFMFSYRRPIVEEEETVRCPRCLQEVPLWNTVTVTEKDWAVPELAPPRVLDYFVGRDLCQACAEVSSVRWERGESQLAFERRGAAAQEESLRVERENFRKAILKKMQKE